MAHIEVTIPVRIQSLNETPHWRTKARTNATHRAAAWFGLKNAAKWTADMLPCVVTLTRIAPRELDDDNLVGGFKSTRDGVADWLGIDDRDKRVQWVYEQQRGSPKTYEARINIRTGT